MAPKPLFPFVLETHLVDHCNLNCRGCSHFAPLVSGEVFLNVEDFKRDLVRLRELFRDVYKISLMGGEPLLHPEINSFIESARQIFPKTKIDIFTNGILLKTMPKGFWQTCRTYNAHIKITQYPISLDFQSIRHLVTGKQVHIKIPNQVNTFYQFININGDSNPQKSFRTCRATHVCPFLRNGKLYTCAFAPHAHYFSQYFNQPLSASNKDYINIHEDITSEDIFDFLKKPISLCQWCKEQRTPIHWGISNKDIDEWVKGDTNKISHTLYIANKYAISVYHQAKRLLAMKWRSLDKN